MQKRVLILVLSVAQQPWQTIEVEGQRKTWAASSDQRQTILWLHGVTGGGLRLLMRILGKAVEIIGSQGVLAWYRNLAGSWSANRHVRIVGDRVITGVPESLMNTNPKLIAGLRQVLREYEFDYLLRTNTSTYVNRKLLGEFVENLPDHMYYGGFSGESDGVRFASGTCMLLSRDAVELIAADRHWEYDFIDDVAIGRSMHRAGVPVQHFQRVDVLSNEDLVSLSAEMLRSTFVVRCKGDQSRDHDVAAMRRVHSLYSEMGLV